MGGEVDGLGVAGVDDEVKGVTGEGGAGPTAGDGGAVEAVALDVGESAGGGEGVDGLVLEDAIADFGGRAGDVDFDEFVVGREVAGIEGVAGACEDGEVGGVPEGGAFFPGAMDEGSGGGAVFDEVGADDVPDLALGLEAGLELVIAGEGVLFEVEEVDGDAGEVGEGDVGEGGAEDGGDLVGGGFVGAGAAGDDADLVERGGESFGDEAMMEAWRIEAASEESDARWHGTRCMGGGVGTNEFPWGRKNAKNERKFANGV
jgi:hypothetical protein